MRAFLLRVFVLTLLLFLLSPNHRALAQCGGDCNGDGRVQADDLRTGVDLALAIPEADACAAADGDGNRELTVDELVQAVHHAVDGCARVSTPPLSRSIPPAGASAVDSNAWLTLDFTAAVASETRQTFTLYCNQAPHPVAVHAIAPNTLLANPQGQLPPEATCELRWLGPDGPDMLGFTTASSEMPATVRYDRTDKRATVPFPDDYWLAEDAAKPNGVRVNIPIPSGPADLQAIFRALLRETNKLDGFSPIAPFVIELSEAPDPASIPQTPADSLQPLASIGLFDLTQGSPTLGQRVPFRTQIRSDRNTRGLLSHSLLLFPSIPLEPGARYGLVMTRQARVTPTRAFGPSPFLSSLLQPPSSNDTATHVQTRGLVEDVLRVLAQQARPPIPADDIALAVRISVRTTDDIPADLLAIRQQVWSAEAPQFTITSVTADPDPDVAAVVRGEWLAPDWREGQYFKRDAEGKPLQTKSNRLPFVLALPAAAARGPVPLTMYQHGNPGSAEREVPSEARRYLGAAGFAVAGFTDVLNRELSPNAASQAEAIAAQVTAIFFSIIQSRRVPDFWVELNAEQLAFIRMLATFGSIDVLPLGAPDGIADINVQAPLTYVGISQGANYAPGLLPYAPEIRAAALVAGGARLAEVLLHQQPQAFLTQLGGIFPSLTAAEIWVGLTLFQHIYDQQDEHNHGRFVYREPLTVAGTTRKASILQIEGLNDSLVPNHASESLAYQLGPLPHLLPVQRAVPFLSTTQGPVRANIDAETTAAFFQYVPVGVDGIDPTPGCLATLESEGHYCSQSAPESQHQRVVFFRTAVDEGIPTIINPFE